MSSDELPPDAPRPRLCCIVKWPDFDGYGFNLHAERSKNGQFIGKIDEGSPAEAAKLKQGDRIVEVNGVNVGNENHKQVVERIKSVPDETRLLVVDAETDDWYRERKIVIKGSLPNVLELRTPYPRPTEHPVPDSPASEHVSVPESPVSEHVPVPESPVPVPDSPVLEHPVATEEVRPESTHPELPEDRQSLSSQSNKSLSVESSSPRNETPTSNGGITNGFVLERPNSSNSVISVDNSSASSMVGSYSPTPSVGSNDPILMTNGSNGLAPSSNNNGPTITNGEAGLNLNMSVQEMRERLMATRKKRTPNHEGLDARKKHEIIEAM